MAMSPVVVLKIILKFCSPKIVLKFFPKWTVSALEPSDIFHIWIVLWYVIIVL